MKRTIKNCMNHIAIVSMLLGMSGCTTVSATGNTATYPTGWATVGHPSYVTLVNVDSGLFMTPYGFQSLKAYTVPSAWSYAATTSSILNQSLAANRRYTLTFNVAAIVGRPTAHFQAELVAVNDSTNTTTVLASVRGNNDGTTNMSYPASIIFTPNASHASLLGQRLAIRLGMDLNYQSSPNANYLNLPLFDNVVLKTTTIDQQYTPNQSDWSTFATKPFPANNAHDPDGVSWITPAQWEAARWDGTIYDPTKMTQAKFAAAICPSVDTLRGLREVFYQNNPFQDIRNPTKAEVDEWHRIAINHVRALVGYTSADRQVQKDQCLFARALWSSQRKYTTMWDAKYPGTLGSSYGPCQGSTSAHCGSTFVPDAADQAPYLPAGYPACSATAGAEGIFSSSKSDIPWSIKFSRSFCSNLQAEGFWGGHTGPWYHREKFGFDFWDSSPSNNSSIAILRAKWGGKSMPSLY